eukprot:9936368-Ditylum_brightwellii.AAC.1
MGPTLTGESLKIQCGSSSGRNWQASLPAVAKPVYSLLLFCVKDVLKDVYVQAKAFVSNAHGLLVGLSEVIHDDRFECPSSGGFATRVACYER